METALIKLPTSARLRQQGSTQLTESVQTAKQFHQGDRVTIELGYNGQLTREFTGFIRRVNFASPCEIECEGYSYQLSRKPFPTGKTWKNASAKEIIADLIEGTDIKLHPDTPDVKLVQSKLVLGAGSNALDGLVLLKEQALQTIYFIDGLNIYSGLAYTAQIDKQATYRLGWNTIEADSLKYRRPEDCKVQVSLTYKDKNGKEHHKTFGKAGDVVVTMNIGATVSDGAALEEIAKARAEKESVPGYEGTITAFLVPYAAHGWKAVI